MQMHTYLAWLLLYVVHAPTVCVSLGKTLITDPRKANVRGVGKNYE